MDSPLAPKPITPGLVAHRVARSGRDKKGKGRSFEEELAAEHEGEEATTAREEPAHPPAQENDDQRPLGPSSGPSGHILDIEA